MLWLVHNNIPSLSASTSNRYHDSPSSCASQSVGQEQKRGRGDAPVGDVWLNNRMRGGGGILDPEFSFVLIVNK